MLQAFLSHSSLDKPFVKQVYSELGAGACIYDETYFRTGATNVEHMNALVEKCGIFVLFWSEATSDSGGVRAELETLRAKLDRTDIPVLVFVIDESQTWKDVPDWLHRYAIEAANSPATSARMIESVIWEAKAKASPSAKRVFVNRDNERAIVANAITQPPGKCPSTLVIAGWEGSGRRSLLRQVLRDTLPFAPTTQPNVILSQYQGLPELYRQILHLDGIRDPDQLSATFESFNNSSISVQLSLVIALLKKRSSNSETVILNADNSIVDGDGRYQHWFATLLAQLPSEELPILAVIQRRNVRAQQKQELERNTLFVHVPALSQSASSLALRTHLKAHSEPYTHEQIEELLPYLGGHPGDIAQAALYARDNGLERLLVDKREFLEMTRRRAIGLLARMDITARQASMLQTLIEYRQVSLRDLLEVSFGATNDEQAVILRSLDQLIEHSIIERIGKYYRVAPFLVDALNRFIGGSDFLRSAQDQREKQRRANALLDIVTNRTQRAGVDSMTIEASIVAAIRSPTREVASWITPLILPSHLLTVAQEAYNDRDYETAVRLASQSLELKTRLTLDATVMAHRLRALAAIRLGHRGTADDALRELSQIPGHNAERNFLFVQGFRHSQDGNLDEAESSFNQCLAIDTRNFHAMRELSRLRIHQQRYREAERFAQRAYTIAPTSPSIVDTLCSVLIGKSRPVHERREDTELTDLLEALRQQDELHGTDFYLNRRAYYLRSLGQIDEAYQMANENCLQHPGHTQALFLRARLSIQLRKLIQAEADISSLKRLIAARIPPNRHDEHQVIELEIDYLRATGSTELAINRLRTTKRLPHATIVRLGRSLAETVATSSDAFDSDIVGWSHDILSGKDRDKANRSRTVQPYKRRTNDLSGLSVNQVLPGHVSDISHRVGIFFDIGPATGLLPKRLIPARRHLEPHFGVLKRQPFTLRILSLDTEKNQLIVDVVTMSPDNTDV